MKNTRLLTVLGAAITAACIGSVVAQEDSVLAVINGFEIKSSDVNAQISTMPLGDQVTIRSDPEKFAESLIQEEVLFQYALRDSVLNEPKLREEIKTIAVNHLIDKYVTQKLEVSDEEVKAYYDANTSAIRGETIQLSHILTETRTECEGLLERVNGGESFADLAQEYSIHESSAINGGEVGSIMNHEGPLGFEQQLFEIPANEYRLFESDQGCHIVVVNGRQIPPLPPVENVEAPLRALLRREKEIVAIEALIANAHDAVEVIRPE